MNREEKIQNNFNRFKANIEGEPVEALEYYNKIIEELKKKITELKYSSSNNSKRSIKDYEKDLENLKKRKAEAIEVLNRIKEKSKPLIKESELILDENLDSELHNFLIENYKEQGYAKVYSGEHLKATQKVDKLRDTLKKELEKSGKKILLSGGMLPITMEDYKELKHNPDESIDLIVESIIKDKEKNKEKQEEKEISLEEEITKSNKIATLLDKVNLTSKQKDDLETSKIRYDLIEKHKKLIKQVEDFIKRINNNPNYIETTKTLQKIENLEIKEIERLEKEIKVILKDTDIDKLYEEHKTLEKLNRKIEVEELEKKRMENSNNKFANDRVPFQEEKLDSLNAERNQLIEEEDPNKNRLNEINRVMSEMEKDEGLKAQRFRLYSEYAKEKVRKTELGDLSFTEYVSEKAPSNETLLTHEMLNDERSRIIYDYYEEYLEKLDGKQGMTFEQFAQKRFNLESLEEPKSQEKTR